MRCKMKRSFDLPVQIRELELKNFKNVNKGKIVFIKNKIKEEYENVIGLYGQNGSGKTTFVNALDLLKSYIANEVVVLPFVNRIPEFFDYFSLNNNKSEIHVKFDMLIKNKPLNIEYDLIFMCDQINKKYILHTEKVSFDIDGEKEYIKYQSKQGHSFSDNYSTYKDVINASLKVAEGLTKQTTQSAIFNDFLIEEMSKKFSNSLLLDILATLRFFAKFNMFVITNKQFGMINLQWNIPFTFRYSKNKEITNNEDKKIKQEELTSGSQVIDLRQPQQVTISFYENLMSMLDNINEVLNRLIPNTKVEVVANDCILSTGQNGKSIELVTNRNNIRIPMRNESTGILKIISIIQTLIAYCTFDDIFVAIDELDAGIFEYLLGSLLELLSKEGKGQLFFSSHNLRPLEILNKNCIYFSTTNENNRYIKLSNVKSNHNLRDFYYRTIILGGQKEQIYNEDDMAGLQIVLRKLSRFE